ncbi:hypothetical protein [Shewanella livingstonensis]|uniref:Uncharacterized protein n=1 Tax=Shewanella livingstonensis TaxID=150120 RepID=A0A3G8LR62_9GAMM|nr:hypothetical protein [Shewanella livingstonensis]AZG71907.1 hypothetical protein EGC82_03490 [Shewanella livingstonensis]
MDKFIAYINHTNKFQDSAGLANVETFMFAKTFIGVDVNFLGEPIFVCKLPSHIIRTQSENPDFKISGFYRNSKLIALMISVHDLANAPYLIISNFVPPLKLKDSQISIKYLSFINEVNEPILAIEIDETVNPPYFKGAEIKTLLSKDELLRLHRTEGVNCKTLCTALLTVDQECFVNRDSDQGPLNLHILASEISTSGEDAVHGHGKRLEDMIHFKALALTGARALCGFKYAMNPMKSICPAEELCDELITYGDFSIFIQEKSIITKPRLRDAETLLNRINTTIKRIHAAAEQLCQHIKSVKEQNNSIYTIEGKTVLPNKILGVIVVSETFEGDVYNNGIRSILNSDPLLREIQLSIMSAEEFSWLVTCTEGNTKKFISTLKEKFNGFIMHGKYGSIPCDLSIASRVQNQTKTR